MNDLIYKNVLLSSKEMKVLAAYCGMENFRIISEYSQKEMNPQEVNETVFLLYQKGILCWNGENGYTLQPEIRSLFRDMKYAAKELEIRSQNQKSPLHCFWNKEIVVTELSQNDVDRIKIHRTKQEEFVEELREREILPFYVRSADESEKGESIKLWEDFQEQYSEILKDNRKSGEQLKNLLEEENDLSAYAIVYDRGKKKEEQIILFLSEKTYGCIAILEKDSVYVERLDERHIYGLLVQQMSEGEGGV